MISNPPCLRGERFGDTDFTVAENPAPSLMAYQIWRLISLGTWPTVTKQSFPDKDVTTIEVDLRLSTLKPIHANVMGQIYQHFKTEGRQTIINGWKAAGVIKAVADARNGHVDDLNPFI